MVEHLLLCLQGNGFKAGPGFHLLLTYMQLSTAEKKYWTASSGKKGKLSPTYRAGKEPF